MMWTLFLLPFLVAAAPDKCAVIPTDLWCGNAVLEETCGFQEACDRYRSGTLNQPLQLTLLMESYCPGCQAFIHNVLYPIIFKNFAGYVDIEIVPFGNAKVQNGSIVCQHGENECRGNKFESCMIDTLKEQSRIVPYIYCFEENLAQSDDFEATVAICNQKNRLSQKEIDTVGACLSSETGDKLQMLAAERTQNVWPEAHTWVPWIMVNNVSLASFQKQTDNLPQLLCKWWNGDRKIPYCSRMNKMALKKKSTAF